jgi:fructosamine-3-kinase
MVLEGDGQRYFVKRNRPELLSMYEAEAAGLGEILASNSLRVPEPVATGSDQRHSWLVLEYLDLSDCDADGELGQGLAAMHRCTSPLFGFMQDNFIGATPQINTWTPLWLDFLREQRLAYQLHLADKNRAGSRLLERGQRLLESLPLYFDNYQPLPSLLHGDLWRGNCGSGADGRPVIFDPAPYYGDREADLAMTELFGGFSDRFYQSYRYSWDIDPGYTTRKVLYNLYHVLNHFNLFGGGYESQALGMVERLLAEV